MDDLKKTQDLNMSEGNPVYVSNAGIVLLNPFISHLFRMLDFLGADRKFKSREDQIRSAYMLQYAVFERTDFPEHELVLNKILVGLPVDVAIPKEIELTEKEKETVDAMLQGAMSHWEKLRRSSINTLREAFLKRSGSFTVSRDNFNVLKVEPKPYDMLLDSLPWSYQILAYSWLDKPIQVEWR